MANNINLQSSSIYDTYSSERLNSTAAKDNQELGQSEFLSLMTTQLNNQSPVSPMDNQAFVAQMAQFSMVSGITEMQQSFNSLAQSLQSNRALEASVLVGRDVYVDGNTTALREGGTAGGAVEVGEPVDSVTVSIMSQSGSLVKTLNYGPNADGYQKFEWDGLDSSGKPMPPGNYTISATGRSGSESFALETTVRARVESVNLRSGSEMSLNLAGVGERTMASIVEIGVAE